MTETEYRRNQVIRTTMEMASSVDRLKQRCIGIADLEGLCSSSERTVSDLRRSEGQRLKAEYEVLTAAFNLLDRMGVECILDFGCAMDRTGMIGKTLIGGAVADRMTIDGLLLHAPEAMTPIAVPNLYERVFTIEEAMEHDYEVVLLLNLYDGKNEEEFSECLDQAASMGDAAVFNCPPEDSDVSETLKEKLSSSGRYRIVEENGCRLVIVDFTAAYYSEQAVVYAVTHKPFRCPEYPMYRPIHAGSIDKESLGYPGDHEGENISALNPYINETTALYWIWKHDRHPVVGLNHYRRFFVPQGMGYDPEWLLTEASVLRVLERYDIILGEPGYYFPMTAQEHLQEMFHYSEASVFGPKIMRQTIAEIQPDFLKSYDRVLQGHFSYLCNLFITSHEVMDAYCNWLFSFLPEAVRRTNEAMEEKGGYLNDFDKRIDGFLVERLMTVWITEQKLRIKFMPVLKIGNL